MVACPHPFRTKESSQVDIWLCTVNTHIPQILPAQSISHIPQLIFRLVICQHFHYLVCRSRDHKSIQAAIFLFYRTQCHNIIRQILHLVMYLPVSTFYLSDAVYKICIGLFQYLFRIIAKENAVYLVQMLHDLRPRSLCAEKGIHHRLQMFRKAVSLAILTSRHLIVNGLIVFLAMFNKVVPHDEKVLTLPADTDTSQLVNLLQPFQPFFDTAFLEKSEQRTVTEPLRSDSTQSALP